MTNRGQKIRDTFRKKYGVDHPSQLPWVKEMKRKKRENGAYDNMVEKIKSTKLKKYGDENYTNPDKTKSTKLKKYGDENYNNREKLIETNIKKYGMKVSPNTVKSIVDRNKDKSVGFSSEKYKKYLSDNNVENVSQLDSIRLLKSKNKVDETFDSIVHGNRLNGKVVALFSREEYMGTNYNNIYKFKCCSCGSIVEDNLYSGHIPRCLTCFPLNRFTSVGQNEMIDFIKDLGYDVESDNRTILGGLELDIIVGDIKLAIEYNGVYWHSEISGGKNKEYHLSKSVECKKEGLNLLHIFDQEWIEKNEIIKSILRSKLGKMDRVFARKLKVVEIDNTKKSEFLSSNHIQGDDKSSIRIALIDETDEILGLMTFCKSRFDKKYQYEMSRFCCKLNTQILGGASKMFSYFIKKYNPASIVSYSDKRLFDGKIYDTLKMHRENDTPVAYHYVKNGSIVGNRVAFQKHKLKDKLETFDPLLTEWENMKNNGYDRIWDCGNLKYTWSKPAV